MGIELPIAKQVTFDIGTGLFGAVFNTFNIKDQISAYYIDLSQEQREPRVQFILTGAISIKL
jgi:hypothetical protein